MDHIKNIKKILNNHKGATAVIVAICLVMLISFAALGIDIGNLAVAKNELQNAADAGALAGAADLLNPDDGSVNPNANQTAYDVATSNMSQNSAVECNWTGGANVGDVQRGHWSFTNRQFTPHDDLSAADIIGVSSYDLDIDTTFVNAVQVITRRQTNPVTAYFARIFGVTGMQAQARAVAYLGFAGKLNSGEIDLPIAICSQSITPSGCDCEDVGKYYVDEDGNTVDCRYSCVTGFMLSDGQDKNTAGWTNYSQPCDTADTNELEQILSSCVESNTNDIYLGEDVGATNGVNDAIIGHPVHNNIVDCWKSNTATQDMNGMPSEPWNVTLLVVDCPDFHVSNCMETCGAVNVNILWILEKENDIDADAPLEMSGIGDEVPSWSFSESAGYDCYNADTGADVDYDYENGVCAGGGDGAYDGRDRWNSFVYHFGIKKVTQGDDDVTTQVFATVGNDGFMKKSIYFYPDCSDHEITGGTGGQNFGIRAKIPVLVD